MLPPSLGSRRPGSISSGCCDSFWWFAKLERGIRWSISGKAGAQRAYLDCGPALRLLGDYTVAFATAAVRSHLHTRRGRVSIECGYQPKIAHALLESWMANRSDRHHPNLSAVQGPI